MNDERQMEIAEALERSHRDKALADVRAKAGAVPPPDWDGVTCYDCGGDMPKERLAANRYRCVGCQGIWEHRSQLFRR